MKLNFLPIFFMLFGLAANAQDIQSLRASLIHYQFNSLPLNPAYAGRLDATGFEAFYYGNFSSQQQLSRSAVVSLHGRGGAGRQLGWGGVLQFHGQPTFNELNFRPAFSRILRLSDSYLSFGGSVGINYFDVDESNASVLNSSFTSVDAGAGVFWHNQRTFIGVSMPNFLEKAFSNEDNSLSTSFGLSRTRPVNLHMGSLFHLTGELYLKPAVLLRYAEIYSIPDESQFGSYNLWSADVHASVFIEGAYVIGVLGGISRPELGANQSRVGASATFLFNNFRFGYALQYNTQAASMVSLPATHTISAGYDFVDEPEEGRRVF